VLDSRVKKRKAPDSVTSKIIPPAKRAAVSTITPAKPVVKREPKVVVTAVKDAKSDSSFFSNKPKAKLPKFTRAVPPSAKVGITVVKSTENVSQPSSFDPFKDALRSMKRTASPKTEARSETPQAESKSTGQLSNLSTVKKKKSVTFAPDSQLEQIKYIEKAVYEDDLSIDVSCWLIECYHFKFVHLQNRPCMVCIQCEIWTAMRVLLCMPITCLRNRWIGRMFYVSIIPFTGNCLFTDSK
jgi:hypothetical protein